VPFRVTIPGPGWGDFAGPAGVVEIGRSDAPKTSVTVAAPTQLFLANGRVERIPAIPAIVRTLRADPHLVVERLPDAAVGGIRATRLLVTVKPFKGYPSFCLDPCVLTFGSPNVTLTVEQATVTRLSLLRLRKRLILVAEQAERRGSSLARLDPLMRSLRIG
jgi:hypothetical protein